MPPKKDDYERGRLDEKVENILSDDEERDRKIKELQDWKLRLDMADGAKKLLAVRCSLVWGAVLVGAGGICSFIVANFEIVKRATIAAAKVLMGKV